MAVLLLEALEENPIPGLFQFLEDTHTPWLGALLCSSLCCASSPSLALLLPLVRTLMITGAIWREQDHLPISKSATHPRQVPSAT